MTGWPLFWISEFCLRSRLALLKCQQSLVPDGMFLVGLDVVGEKLMEINVFSPGGLGSAQRFEKVNFTSAAIKAMERKVQYMKYYRRNFGNVELATL